MLLKFFLFGGVVLTNGKEQRPEYACPNVTQLNLERDVAEVGKLDSFGNYEVAPATIHISTTQSTQCASDVHFQIPENKEVDFFMSCVSG